jgi:hypothetical protein
LANHERMIALHDTIERFTYVLNAVPPLLHKVEENTFSTKPAPDKWSKKEILGHLIDSAANNHQRFVRAQFEHEPSIVYDQDKWNEFSYHALMRKDDLIDFWLDYNRYLLKLIKLIPNFKLSKTIRVGHNTHTLQFIIEDYLVHMEYHLKQIVDY